MPQSSRTIVMLRGLLLPAGSIRLEGEGGREGRKEQDKRLEAEVLVHSERIVSL